MRSRLLPAIGAFIIGWGIPLTAGAIDLSKYAVPAPATPVPEAVGQTVSAAFNAMMVYGEDKFKMKSQKSALDLTKDINEPLTQMLAALPSIILNYGPDETVYQHNLPKGAPLASGRVLKPLLLNRIPTPPFLGIAAVSLGRVRSDWDFTVTTDIGNKTVYQKHGSAKDLPAMLTWHGRDNQGNWALQPGRKYLWSFKTEAQDEVKKGTLVSAVFRLYETRKQSVWMQTGVLFPSEASNELSKTGKELLDEMSYCFRESRAERLSLVFGGNTNLSGSLGPELARTVSEILMIDLERVSVEYEPAPDAVTQWVEFRFTNRR
jgi:hypothetical protein